ncbi:MAG: hypothetical protein AABX82_05275 [Nanoarchaeota archaeon]
MFGALYVPPFPTELGKRMFDDIPLPIKEWGTIHIGLNDVVFQQDTPLEAIFFDPLGDSVVASHHRSVKDYAVVASDNLYAPFKDFVATRDVRPGIETYVCNNETAKYSK